MKATTSGIVMKPSGSSPSYAYPGSRHCQFGVSKRSESHRSALHEFATSLRSRTTWSIERSARQRLIARPPCPAPMTTVVICTMYPVGAAGLADLDAHGRRVGDDVVHGRALLRLRDDRLNLVGRRVGVDLVDHLDSAEAIADIRVHAEDALYIHVALERRRDLVQLDLPVLCDCGHACRQAARETHEHVLDRRGAVVRRCEDLRMIGVEHELGAVVLLVAEAEEALDDRPAVRAVLPFTGRPPLEFCGRRVLSECLAGAEQGVDIDTVVDWGVGSGHS